MKTTLKEHNIPVYEKLEGMMEKNNKALVVTATGTGKSYLTLEYINNHKLNALIVVPRISIGNEWKKLSKKITTITYHSFVRTHNFDKYDCVVFDEVHHAGATTWQGPITNFITTTDKAVIGLTADPKRYSDGARDMGEELFKDCRVDGYNLTNAIEKSILPKLTYVAALWDVGTMREEYKKKDIPSPLMARFNYALDKRKPIEEIIAERMPEGDRKGIIFAETITATNGAKDLIKNIYPNAQVWIIHSAQSSKLNEKYHNEFRKAKSGFMIAVDMYNEGLHAPGVNTIIMLRRTSSPTIFYQQIGRALHVGDATDPIIFDLVYNSDLLKVTSTQRERTVGPSLIHITPEISSQTVIYDYTKDILDVIKEIDLSLDNSWTDEEIAILAEYYPTEGYLGVQKRLPNRTVDSIQFKAKKLRITSAKYWTEEEDEIIRKYYPSEGTDVYKRLKNRKPYTVSNRAHILGVKAYKKDWTDYEDEIVRKYYPTGGTKKVRSFIDKDTYFIRNRAKELGVTYLGHGFWSEEELDTIRKFYPLEGTDTYKRLPNRTRAVVIKKANEMGITKRVIATWTDEEDEVLRKYYPVEGLQKTVDMLEGKTYSSVRARIAKLGLRPYKKRNKKQS